jgi:hypothetical protein
LSPHRRFDHRHVIAATPLLWAPSRCFSTLPSGHCHLVVPAPMLFWLPSCCSTHICCLDHRRGAFRRDHALYTISDPVVDGAFWFYAFFLKNITENTWLLLICSIDLAVEHNESPCLSCNKVKQ